MAGIVPQIGLGTSQNDDPDVCPETVQTALEMGYRHIDTAQMYNNEALVGEGIAAADVPREDVFLATKVTEHKLAYDDVIESTHESLNRLGVDYIDLLYVHFPIDTYDPSETLPAFEELQAEGVIDHIGVSNFTADLLAEAHETLDAPLIANQVEIHPMLDPEPGMVEFCQANGIDIVAYSPFCRGEAFDLPEVKTVAERHNVSPARTILAWLFSKSFRVIPKSVGVDHLRDNLKARSLELSAEDIELIESVDRRKRRFDRPGMPWD